MFGVVIVGLGAYAWVIAEQQDPITWLSGSVLGIVILLLIFGWLWPRPSVEQLKADKLKAEEQRDDMIVLFRDEVMPVLNAVKDRQIPALEASTAAIARVEVVLAEAQKALNRRVR